MKEQKEKAAQCEAAEKTELKCLVCGNERIKEKHNYCGVCGSQLKENPVILVKLMEKWGTSPAPHITKVVNEWLAHYPFEQIKEAVNIAVDANCKNIAYINAVLKKRALNLNIDNS